MESLLSHTMRLLQGGENAVWATVIQRSGSAPRATGSRMVVDARGGLLGSVGGGRLEADALGAAAKLHDSPGCRLLVFDLTSQEVSQTEMICGGRVALWMETLSTALLPLLDHLLGLLRAGEDALLLTRLSEGGPACRQARHLVRGASGSRHGRMDISPREWSEAQSLLFNGRQGMIACEPDREPIFAEVIQPRDRLYIFGGGHVSLEVAWLAERVGFSVAVVDDRREFANPERFPMAEATWALPFDEFLSRAALGGRDYVVIVTRGHLHDLDVLRLALRQGPRYLGMMGSRRKRGMIFAQLEAEGVSRERLAQVSAPIGLDIGAETPAELAVSIVAELVAARAGRPALGGD